MSMWYSRATPFGSFYYVLLVDTLFELFRGQKLVRETVSNNYVYLLPKKACYLIVRREERTRRSLLPKPGKLLAILSNRRRAGLRRFQINIFNTVFVANLLL